MEVASNGMKGPKEKFESSYTLLQLQQLIKNASQ